MFKGILFVLTLGIAIFSFASTAPNDAITEDELARALEQALDQSNQKRQPSGALFDCDDYEDADDRVKCELCDALCSSGDQTDTVEAGCNKCISEMFAVDDKDTREAFGQVEKRGWFRRAVRRVGRAIGRIVRSVRTVRYPFPFPGKKK